MTAEQLAAMHRLLAEYHRKLAKEAAIDVVQQYHADLVQRLADDTKARGDPGTPSRTRTTKNGGWWLQMRFA